MNVGRGGWHFKRMPRKVAQGTELLMVEHQAPVGALSSGWRASPDGHPFGLPTGAILLDK